MFTKRNLFMLIGRHMIAAFAAIIIALGASVFLAREITHVSDTVVENRHLAAVLEKRTERFSTLARDIAVIGSNDAAFDRAFLPSDNILEFISALDELALRNGTAQSFHFENPLPVSTESPFPLSMIGYTNNLSLTITGLTTYLKDFERLPYFTNIGSLTITSADPQGWRGTSNIYFHATLITRTAQ